MEFVSLKALWNLCNMRSGMFHPLVDWLFIQARISCFIFPGLVIVDKWRDDKQRTYKEHVLTLVSRQRQFSLSSINICKQFNLTLRSSTNFSPYGLKDCDPAPQLPALWSVNDICWLYMAIIHMICACICTCMLCHYPIFTFLLIRTELGMLRDALWSQDQLHGFTVRETLRHVPHFHHHLTDAR